MLALTIIIVCSLLVGLIAVPLYLRQRRFAINHYLIVAAIVSVVIGAWLIVSQTTRFQKIEDMKHWSTAPGEIINSWLEGERAMHPVVKYSYTVDSVEYTREDTLYTPSFGGKRRKYEVSMKTLALYPPGISIDVLYDPSNPKNAFLELPEHWDLFGKFSLGATLYILGLLTTVAPKVRGRT